MSLRETVNKESCTASSTSFTGQFAIDDTLLHTLGGVTDFEPYRVDPTAELAPDFFVPDGIPVPPGVKVAKMPIR